ncbi:MAG: hypothetical protein RLZZ621_562 [Gemmatimonadota bacterium]
MAPDGGRLHIVLMSESHGSTQEWQLAEELFQRALDLEPAARTAFIANLPVPDAVRLAVLKRMAGHDTSLMLSSLKPDLLAGHSARPVPDHDAPWMALPADAPYRVGEAIGRDAVASRFRARRSTDEAAVVLEFLAMDVPADPQSQEAVRETNARLLALAHPHLGIPVDCGDTDEGQLYFVRAGDEGETLARRLRRVPPLGADERTALLAAVQSAISAAHTAGVAHGQLRPEWIILTPNGQIQLYGFGVQAIVARAPITPDADAQAMQRLTELLQG